MNTRNASHYETHFLHHAYGGQYLLGEGNNKPTEQAQEALGALAGIVALDGHTNLHHAPAEDNNADGLDAGKDKIAQVIYNVC